MHYPIEGIDQQVSALEKEVRKATEEADSLTESRAKALHRLSELQFELGKWTRLRALVQREETKNYA